jgi:hypothetical protein
VLARVLYEWTIICWAAGLSLTAKASIMHPSGVGHVLPWESNPIFTRRRGGSKRGGECRGVPIPTVFGPLAAGWVRGFWPLGSCLVGLSVSIISQIFLITAYLGLATLITRVLHGMPTWISNVDGMSGIYRDIDQDPPSALHTCTRGEPTWISNNDSVS